MPAAAPARTLYLVAYDIRDNRRLARVTRAMKGRKVAGQKSFCECWLTPAEYRVMMSELKTLMRPEADRVHLFELDPRMQPRLFGVAHSFDPGQPLFTIL